MFFTYLPVKNTRIGNRNASELAALFKRNHSALAGPAGGTGARLPAVRRAAATRAPEQEGAWRDGTWRLWVLRLVTHYIRKHMPV